MYIERESVIIITGYVERFVIIGLTGVLLEIINSKTAVRMMKAVRSKQQQANRVLRVGYSNRNDELDQMHKHRATVNGNLILVKIVWYFCNVVPVFFLAV